MIPKTRFEGLYTVCSFQYSGVFAAFLLVFLSVFCLFAAFAFFLGFASFSYVLLFFLSFTIFSYVPSEQPVDAAPKPVASSMAVLRQTMASAKMA